MPSRRTRKDDATVAEAAVAEAEKHVGECMAIPHQPAGLDCALQHKAGRQQSLSSINSKKYLAY